MLASKNRQVKTKKLRSHRQSSRSQGSTTPAKQRSTGACEHGFPDGSQRGAKPTRLPNPRRTNNPPRREQTKGARERSQKPPPRPPTDNRRPPSRTLSGSRLKIPSHVEHEGQSQVAQMGLRAFQSQKSPSRSLSSRRAGIEESTLHSRERLLYNQFKCQPNYASDHGEYRQ